MIRIWDHYIPLSIRNRVKNRPTLWKVAGNTGWLFIDRVLRLAVAMVIGIWVARYLGPDQFGLLSYAGAFVGLFAAIATLGLNNLAVREIVNHPTQKYIILGTTFGLQLLGGFLTFGLAVGTILLLHPDDVLTHWLVIIIAAGSVFGAFNVIDLWFQSQIKSKFTVIAKSISLLSSPVIKIILILTQAPLVTFALVGLAEMIIGAIGLLVTYHLTGETVRRWRFRMVMAGRLLRESWPLILSALAIVIYMKIDQIMLKEMIGNEAVGVYAAAARISTVWYFVPVTIVSSLFPVLVAAKKQGEAAYYRKFRATFRLLVGLGYAVAIPITFLAGWLMITLFGADYASAGPILSVHIWAGVPVAMGVATTPWLINEGYTRLSLQKSLFGAAVNVGVNMLLIPLYAGLGAAIATIVAQFSADILFFAFYRKTRPIFLAQLKSMLLFV